MTCPKGNIWGKYPGKCPRLFGYQLIHASCFNKAELTRIVLQWNISKHAMPHIQSTTSTQVPTLHTILDLNSETCDKTKSELLCNRNRENIHSRQLIELRTSF